MEFIVDAEIKENYNGLRKQCDKVKEGLFDKLFPKDLDETPMFIDVHFLNPSWDDLDSMCDTYEVTLSDIERKMVYPMIITFVKYIKNKFIRHI